MLSLNSYMESLPIIAMKKERLFGVSKSLMCINFKLNLYSHPNFKFTQFQNCLTA